MHHSKPVLHEGRGDSQSELEGGLADSLTIRMPQWLRARLDERAETAGPPLSLTAQSAGSVAREFIAAGLLKQTLRLHASDPQITEGTDLPADQTPPQPLHTNHESQLTVRMPTWLKTHLRDEEGELADGLTATARELLWIGEQLYEAGAFPYGEPTAPNDDVRCPNCYETSTAGVWQRSFEFHPHLDDVFDELSTERENPYRAYIERHYANHGWDPTEIRDRDHPLYGLDPLEISGTHPDVDEIVTVSHCYLCGHTDHKDEFIRAYYAERAATSDSTVGGTQSMNGPLLASDADSQPMTQSDTHDTTARTDTPAYDGMREMLSGQAMGVGDALSGETEARKNPDPDPDGQVLDAISAGNSVAGTQEEVSTLAALGYSIETAAEALGREIEDVEALAEARLRELMRMRVDESKLPDEDDLWRLYYIIFTEEYVDTFLNIEGTKYVAEQTEWASLVNWIEDTVEQPDGDDWMVWIAAVEEAVRQEEQE